MQTLTTVADGTGAGEKPVLSSYSYEGPPYVQLIEGQDSGELRGVAASAGKATGRARVIIDPDVGKKVR